MAIIPVILGLGQKCPKCHQSSSPKVGQGLWEIMGVWNGPIHRCMRCNSLVRVGFISDVPLTTDDADGFLRRRQAKLGQFEEQTRHDSIPNKESLLSNRFWNLTSETKRCFVQDYFVRNCVDPVAKQMAATILERFPETRQLFAEQGGLNYLAGELGAMIIDGYFAGRVGVGNLPETHPITQVPKEHRDHLFSLVMNRWKEIPVGDISAELNDLLAELVTLRLNMPGFQAVKESEGVGEVLYLLVVNGVQWARAEKDVIG